jgi:5-methylcytosine-specific restriction enzyme subunit McrC
MCKPISIQEHFDGLRILDCGTESTAILFQKNERKRCLEIVKQADGQHKVKAGYHIGVDWISENKSAVYVQPKLNNNSRNTDYLKMLFSALKHAEVANYTEGLFEIKFDKPYIEIEQKQDLLTPLLVVQFLQIVKTIVRKGLKKSYYKVDNNLNSKVKGKIVVSKTLKNNILKNKITHTVCQYEEFGYNSLENRLLKKALLFVQRYLPTFKMKESQIYANKVFNYILPAFEHVEDTINLNDIKHTKTNAFYKEYEEGLRLARLILKRFGYNITTVDKKDKVRTPPFWIDMSKLFELYVLGLLKDRFKNQIDFQVGGNYGDVDYLIKFEGNKMVVDAKYKTYYNEEFRGLIQWKRDSIAKDIRQLSGYARDKSILDKLGVAYEIIPDCLIIYPDQNADEQLKVNLKETEITQFVQFFKTAIKLPEIV